MSIRVLSKIFSKSKEPRESTDQLNAPQRDPAMEWCEEYAIHRKAVIDVPSFQLIVLASAALEKLEIEAPSTSDYSRIDALVFAWLGKDSSIVANLHNVRES